MTPPPANDTTAPLRRLRWLTIVAALALVLAVVATICGLTSCGASLEGHDTTNTVDPCQNRLTCRNGCCRSASFDGQGWDCCLPWEQCICKWVGGIVGRGLDAGDEGGVDAALPHEGGPDATLRR